MYELAIIGGGPAGAAAAVYAARKRLKTVMILEEWGGQSGVSTDIQNWIGTPSISGADLADSLKKHVMQYAGEFLTILSPVRATGLTPKDTSVEVALSKGEPVVALAVLITTGANRRKLEVKGAAEYDQKGLTYCASCDGPLFADKDVADAISVNAALANPKMRVVKNSEILEVVGETFVTGLRWKDSLTGKEELLPVEGIFVEIGLIPNTAWVGSALEMNAVKQIKVDPRTHQTSHPRVWAAGDCTDGLYHQNNIAAGDAVKALEDIYLYLHAK